MPVYCGLSAAGGDAAVEGGVGVEGVYAAFAHHRLPAVIDYCGHCVTAEENEMLTTVPLRQLSMCDSVVVTFRPFERIP